jgi:hypothetical protein
MGNIITATADSFLTPVTYFTNSEDSAYPGTNAISVTTPNNPYKGTNAASTSEFLTYDFGTAFQTIGAVVVDNTNVPTLRIKGNATNSGWGSPSLDSGDIVVSIDGKDGRYKLFYTPVGFLYRYLRLECRASNTDPWHVGCLLAISSPTTWTQNFAFPYTPTNDQVIDAGTKTGGGAEPSVLGNRFAQITLPTSGYLSTNGMEAVFDSILGQRAKPLMFYRNFGNTSEVYLGTVTNAVTGPSRTSQNILQVSQITIREFA